MNLTVQRQTYPCPSWQADFCQLSLGSQRIEATPNTFSPPCQVIATLVWVRTIEELAVADVTGSILVLCGELTKDPIMSLIDHAVYLPERDRQIGLLLRQKQPQAIVTVSSALEYTPLLLEDPRLHIPSVTVSAEMGLLMSQSAGASATLAIASSVAPGQTSNIIGVNRHPTGAKRMILCAQVIVVGGNLGFGHQE